MYLQGLFEVMGRVRISLLCPVAIYKKANRKKKPPLIYHVYVIIYNQAFVGICHTRTHEHTLY